MSDARIEFLAEIYRAAKRGVSFVLVKRDSPPGLGWLVPILIPAKQVARLRTFGEFVDRFGSQPIEIIRGARWED